MQECTEECSSAQKNAGVHIRVQECTEECKSILECVGVFRIVQKCVGVHRRVQECSEWCRMGHKIRVLVYNVFVIFLLRMTRERRLSKRLKVSSMQQQAHMLCTVL